MQNYDELLHFLVKKIISEDELKRHSKGQKMKRSQAEAAEYRSGVDALYKSTTEAFSKSARALPKPLETVSSLFMPRQPTEFHKLLNDFLIGAHAGSVALNDLTRSRGRHDDIGLFCNLYALSGVLSTISQLPEAAVRELLEPIQTVDAAFDDLNIGGWQFSETGLLAGGYWHWLLYDPIERHLSLDLLPELANGAKGNLDKYRAGIIGLWVFKQGQPNASMKPWFHENVLANVPRWVS